MTKRCVGIIFERHARGVVLKSYWVYILASRPRGTLYIGVTNNLLARVAAHKRGKGSEFTSRHRVATLVWYEPFSDVRWALQREKTLKHYTRAWKTNLVERENLQWEDLYPKLMKQYGLTQADLRIIER